MADLTDREVCSNRHMSDPRISGTGWPALPTNLVNSATYNLIDIEPCTTGGLRSIPTMLFASSGSIPKAGIQMP
jgi:hypothetical protein